MNIKRFGSKIRTALYLSVTSPREAWRRTRGQFGGNFDLHRCFCLVAKGLSVWIKSPRDGYARTRDRVQWALDSRPRLRTLVKGGYLCLTSPREAGQKIKNRVHAKADSLLEPYRRVRFSTYAKAPFKGKVARIFSISDEGLFQEADTVRQMAARIMMHEFDLLGSGWTIVERNIRRAGVHGHIYVPQQPDDTRPYQEWLEGIVTPGNMRHAGKIARWISESYCPISWEEDFKSGFVWSVGKLRTQLTYGSDSGVDVKVPWELSRMQHLPWLAFAAMLARKGEDGFEAPNAYVREFMDQTLDFAAVNAPKYGPNWLCTMDVAFRAVSLIATYDFFLSAGFNFPAYFKSEFQRIIRDHGEHVISHLEYDPNVRANHYYSDIVGLLYVAAWLPSNPDTDCWLAFAVQEYLNESKLQFHEDGSNFEASTSYHRMCSEMLVYGAALLKGLPGNRIESLRNYDHSLWKAVPHLEPSLVLELDKGGLVLPQWLVQRIEGARRFAIDITSPEGNAVQIGDNDSGRFLKLFPVVEMIEGEKLASIYDNINIAKPGRMPFEVMGDYRHLVAAIDALLPPEDGRPAFETPEFGVVARISGEEYPRESGNRAADKMPCSTAPFAAYPDYGLWIWRRDGFFLTVRCGHNGQYDNGGHAHNDQLSFTLAVDGIEFLVDPGTYLYTPLPEWRNRFRMTESHNTLSAGREQNGFKDITLFSVHNDAKPGVVRSDEGGFKGFHDGFGHRHTREIIFDDDAIVVQDACSAADVEVNLILHPDVKVKKIDSNLIELKRSDRVVHIVGLDWEVKMSEFSNGYGWKQPTNKLKAPMPQDNISWKVFSPLSNA